MIKEKKMHFEFSCGRLFRRLGVLAAFSVFLLLFSSCASTDNNDRSLEELVSYMSNKVGGTYSGKMFVPPVKAMDGVSMQLEGRDVVFYKYDTKLAKQRKKLEQIEKSGKLYINGIQFPALVNGSFVMIAHDTNLKKKELIQAFKSF